MRFLSFESSSSQVKNCFLYTAVLDRSHKLLLICHGTPHLGEARNLQNASMSELLGFRRMAMSGYPTATRGVVIC
jgi:hypothetical protein